MIKKLKNLIKLDIDAKNAYNQAIDHVDDPAISSAFQKFRDDHNRHVEEISKVVREYGGEPPKMSPDFKGYLIEGFTSLRSVSGTSGALKAMKTNEKMTNKKYSDAQNWDVPADVKEILQRNFQDEKNHLTFIEEKIKVKT